MGKASIQPMLADHTRESIVFINWTELQSFWSTETYNQSTIVMGSTFFHVAEVQPERPNILHGCDWYIYKYMEYQNEWEHPKTSKEIRLCFSFFSFVTICNQNQNYFPCFLAFWVFQWDSQKWSIHQTKDCSKNWLLVFFEIWDDNHKLKWFMFQKKWFTSQRSRARSSVFLSWIVGFFNVKCYSQNFQIVPGVYHNLINCVFF